jgi:hypothetical protein
MESEHEEIDPAMVACRRGFEEMVGHPCADHRNALDVHVTTTRAALLDHLRHEETEALPLLQRVMTSDEYAAAEAAAARGYPLSLMSFLVPWAMEGVPDVIAGPMLRDAGAAYALALRIFRGSFRRREARTFRCV